jgi:hypothetical protein
MEAISIFKHGENLLVLIFALLTTEFPALPTSQTQLALLQKTRNFSSTEIDLLIPSRQVCSIESLTANIVSWLNGIVSSEKPKLSAAEFLAIIRPVAPNEMASKFQRLIYAESYSGKSLSGLTETEFQEIGAIVGEHCLHFLDKTLTSQKLSSFSKDELQILFLVIVNTISAISCTVPVSQFKILPSALDIVCSPCRIMDIPQLTGTIGHSRIQRIRNSI